MGAIKDSIKIIEKSEQEIDSLKGVIDKLNLSEDDKAAIIYGLNLIISLPKLLLEQRITTHRLQQMLFGKAAPPRKSTSKCEQKSGNNNEPDGKESASDIDTPANDEDLDITAPSDTEDAVVAQYY